MKQNKVVKIAARWLGIPLLCFLVAVLLLLFSPPVQQKAAHWAAQWLQKRLQNTVRIARFELDFPRRVVLGNVFVTDAAGDTLLNVGSLVVETNFWKLFRDTLPIYGLALHDAHLRLAQADARWNYQFILDAFDDGQPPSGHPPSLFVAARRAPVLLQNVRFEWEDTASHSHFRFQADSLHGTLQQVRMDTLQIDFSNITDNNGRIVWRTDEAPPPEPGTFRPDHIDLRNTRLQVGQLRVKADSILASVAAIQASDAGGLQMSVSTDVTLVGDRLALKKMRLQANESWLAGGISLQTRDALHYRFEPLEGQLRSADVTYFTDYPYFKKHPDEVFDFVVEGSGSLDDLRLQKLDLQTKHGTTALSLSGHIHHLRQATRLGGDLTVSRFRTNVRTVQTFVPAGTLPEGMAADDVIQMQGRFRGDMRQLELSLTPLYQPTGQERKRPMKADISATIANAGQPRLIQFDTRLHSLDAPGDLVEKMLPPGTLPPSFELPEMTHLSGSAKGDMRRVDGQLNLRTGENGSAARLDFSLADWQGASARYQVELVEATLDSTLLAPFFRDTALSQYLHLPPQIQAKGTLTGGRGGLGSEISLNIPKGGRVELAYRDSVGNMDVTLRSEQLLPAALVHPALLADWGFDTTQRLDVSASITSDSLRNIGLEARLQQLEWSGWHWGSVRLEGKKMAANGNFQDLRVETCFEQRALQSPVPFLSSGHLRAHLDHLFLPFLDTLDQHRPLLARGGLLLDSLKCWRDTVQVFPSQLTAQIGFSERENIFEINSDWLEGSLAGRFDNRKLPELLVSWLDKHLQGDSSSFSRAHQDSLAWQIAMRQPGLFANGLIPGLTALDTVRLSGFYQPGLMGARLQCDQIAWQGHRVRQLEGMASLDESAGTVIIRSPAFKMSYKSAFEGLDFGARLEKGIVTTHLQVLDSLGRQRVALGAALTQDSIWYARLEPVQTIQYQQWAVSAGNRINFPTATAPLAVHDFEMRLDSQMLRLEGDLENRLRAEFQSLDLSLLPTLLQLDSVTMGGLLEGVVRIDSLQSDDPTIRARLGIGGLKYNEADVGNLSFGILQTGRDAFKVTASVQGANEVELSGDFGTKTHLNLNVFVKKLRLETAMPFVKTYFHECSGELAGQMEVGGILEKPDVSGIFQLNDAAIRPTVNNVRYRLNGQTLRIAHNAIVLDSLQMTDERNRRAWLNGRVDLNNMDSVELDLQFAMQEFLVLKTIETSDVPYFGTLMTDATGTVKGKASLPVVMVNVKPSGDSELWYRYDDGQRTLNESVGIVVFVNPNEPATPVEEVAAKTTFPFRLEMNLELKDNNNLKLKVILNQMTRDVLEAKGRGNLHLDVFPHGDIELNGRVEIVSGTAEYSYNNFFKRTFMLAKGGSLMWTKDPYNPVMDLAAHYVVKTSPLPLLAGQSNQPNIGVQTFWLTASMRGYMDDAELKFELAYPIDAEQGTDYKNTGNPDIIQAVNQINENPAAISQQVFSLIVFKSLSGSGLDQARVVDWQAGLNNMISQQLNALASDISWVDIDFKLNDASASGQADLDFRVKKSFFNDRVTFRASGETSFDYAGSNGNSSGVGSQFDNILVEYKINRSGTLKATAFSEQAFNGLFQRRINQTGAGLIFEKEYLRLSDIFNRSPKAASAPKPAQ
ncbi:MAG: translocation/assembly module TamB domain-containing protein [Saprospiraceae bacterium]|nr:translocation/assembly module TamB domain-containing protein [Saprospiraceae bacterium]